MRSKNTCICFFFLLTFGYLVRSNAQVVINEFSCSNLSQYVDNHTDYNDWIELYNTSASVVSLTGYYLSDDSANVLIDQQPENPFFKCGIKNYSFV